MAIIIISIMAFVIMLLFPILFSLFSLRQSSGKVLEIDQSKIKDPRYFAKSFTRLFDQKWENYDGSGKINLSREENLLEADKLTEYPAVCQSIVYAESREFKPQAVIRFEKEVYSRQDAYLAGIEMVRAICSKKNLFLGRGTQVLRWVDAEGTLTVADGCDLGISASSATKITLGNDCQFRRLFAPEILFGQAPRQGRVPPTIKEQPITYRNLKYVNDDLADEHGVLTGSIISIHDITVLNRLTVNGHLRSHKTIRLCDNATVYGNLFAEGDIYLGENATVYGSVLTQGALYAERGVVVGQPGKIKSIIARGKVTFEKNCCVYGYVSSEEEGKCCPDLSGIVIDSLTDLPSLPLNKYFLPKKNRPAVIAAVLFFAVITTSITGTALLQNIQENERLFEDGQTAAKQLAFGVDGKPGGGPLSTEPTMVTDDHVYFEDRVLERFHYNADHIIQSTEVLTDVMTSVPQTVNKYLMLVPTRINFEGDKHKTYTDDMTGAITEIYSTMPSDVRTIDVVNALMEHRDEYLFFRTEDVWTALGAYYAAKEFCEYTDINMIGIEKYREQRFDNYLGTMSVLPYTESLNRYPDYVSYYLLEGATNEQTITVRRGKDDYRTYKSPTVALSRLGYDIFVGAYFSHSILHGDKKSAKSLMIVGDNYSKALAPWLTPYYENILLVNPMYFTGGSKEFWDLFSKYQVTDLLIMQNAQSLGNDTINAKLREFALQPQNQY